jgi:nitrogen regulatory protein PII
MDMICAVINPKKLDEVKLALARLGILGATAIEVNDCRQVLGHTERYRGRKLEVGMTPRIMLQVCVKPVDRDPAVYAIAKSARTGKAGDGTLFVSPISRVVRIRTGEEDERAL